MGEPVVINTPNGIQYAQLAALKGAVKLESLGMKHSSGRSMKKRAMDLLGLKGRKTHEQVVDALKARMDEMLRQSITK